MVLGWRRSILSPLAEAHILFPAGPGSGLSHGSRLTCPCAGGGRRRQARGGLGHDVETQHHQAGVKLPRPADRVRSRIVLAFVTAICLPAMTITSEAQPVTGHRIGLLSPAVPSALAARLDAFRQGLAELGYREGQNLAIEYRWGEGRDDRLPGLAADLVKLKVAIILAHGVQAAQTARLVSGAIPIICFTC